MANTQIRTGNEKQTETKHMCGDYISHAKSAENAEFYFPLLFTLTLEMSQVSLRQENAEAGGLNQKSEMRNEKSENSSLNNRSTLPSVSVVGTLRAASVLPVSLSALDVCLCFRTLHATSLCWMLPLTAHRSPLNVPRSTFNVLRSPPSVRYCGFRD